MGLKTISALCLAAFVALGSGLAIAQDAAAPVSNEETLAMRIALMRSNGMTMRGAGDLSGEAAIAAMTTILSNYQTMPSLFPEGSGGGESDALPAVWEDFEAFTAIAETGATAAQAGLDAASAGDTAAYMAAVQQINQTCGTCHQQFRAQ